MMMMMSMEDCSSPDPPFNQTYRNLLNNIQGQPKTSYDLFEMEECELPLVDLNKLNMGEFEKEECKKEIEKSSKEWGFFQVKNHGISREILEKMRLEQVKVFKKPFQQKMNDKNLLAGSYRWGTPSATCLKQLAWSEAFHVPLNAISGQQEEGHSNLSYIMEKYATTMSELAQKLAEILAEKMGQKSSFFRQTCLPSTCYLRMNRYPPCPVSPQVFGSMPHTDSDFITLLHQDQIGGLQLFKDGKWIAVKPNPEALIINIGDLFQAWSNGVYKSVEHRVVTNMLQERFSVAFFMCPSYETVIQSCVGPAVYRRFSFKEYRDQVQDDVKHLGNKVGLPRFLV